MLKSSKGDLFSVSSYDLVVPFTYSVGRDCHDDGADGDADFYITTDLDKAKNENYVWTLYLQRDGGFFPAERITYPVPARKDLCGLPSIVTASKSSFCRIVRLDVDPIFLIVDGNTKNQIRDAIKSYLGNPYRIEKLACHSYVERAESEKWKVKSGKKCGYKTPSAFREEAMRKVA